jgi:PadR family transcriptional regulator, regulatory protein PadR
MVHRFEDLGLTPRMADVIRVFLQNPAERQYGFGLMRATGLPSGTLYPILAKFERHGWLTVGTEHIDPKKEGRPPRRFYVITAPAWAAAEEQLYELHERYRPPPRGDADEPGWLHPLPAPEDGSR